MIDTSALMALLLGEPEAAAVAAALEAAEVAVISAGTLAEALIVARRRGVDAELKRLVGGLGLTVEPLGEAGADRVAEAYGQWGKGVHPAGLNFGDCFAYALARDRDMPLLFVGEDFARTDVAPALP